MVISTQSASCVLLGNSATQSWSIPFICDSADFIEVAYTDADGVQTILSPSVYTLTLNPPAVGSLWGIGAALVYPISGSPIASGTSLTVSRILPLIQVVSIANQGDFAPLVIEEALDTLEMQLQQVSARTGQIRGVWVSGADYNYGDVVQDGANGANSDNYYMCAIANTSGVWATDLAAGDWSLAIQGAIPAAALPLVVASGGTGATTAAGARTNLGLGTMAIQNASTVAITGGTISADYFRPLSATVPVNGMYLPAANTLGFSGNSELSFKIGANPFGTSANRNLTVYPGASASSGVPYIASEGTGSAIALGYVTKSTGTTRDSHYFYAGDELILSVFGTQVAQTMDRHVTIEPGFSASSQFPSIRGYTTATPGSGNTPFGILSEGTGYIGLHTRGGNPGAGGSDVLQCMISDTASAVNYWSITGAALGGSPNTQLAGSNTNISGIFASKGTGSWGFYTGTTRPQLIILDKASSVNWLTIAGATASGQCTVVPAGASALIGIDFNSKGSGPFAFNCGTFTVVSTDSVVLGGTVSVDLTSDGAITLTTLSSSNITITAGGTATVTGANVALTPSGNVTSSANVVMTAAAKGLVLKRGANGKTGSFTLSGTTAVTVNNTNIATSDVIHISLNTVGGTVGAQPIIKTLTAASGFTVAGTVGDISVYNYAVISSII